MGIFDRIVGQLGELIEQIDPQGSDDVRLHLERGEGLLLAGDLDGAVRELSRVLALRPEHPRAALLLGRAQLERGDAAAAASVLQQSLAARADQPDAEVLLGEALGALGQEREAIEALRRGLDGGVTDPDLRGAAWRGLGSLHLSAGRADRAVRELRKAAASLPGDAETNRLLGQALAARGDLEGARVCLDKAVAALAADPPEVAAPEPRPGEPTAQPQASGAPIDAFAARRDGVRAGRRAEALCQLARVQRRLGRYAEAASSYRSALDERPGLVEGLLGLAELSAEAGDHPAALREALRALERERSPRTLLALARLASAPPKGQAPDAQALDAQALYAEAHQAASSRAERANIAAEALRRALRAVDDEANERARLALAQAAAWLEQDRAAPGEATGGPGSAGAGPVAERDGESDPDSYHDGYPESYPESYNESSAAEVLPRRTTTAGTARERAELLAARALLALPGDPAQALVLARQAVDGGDGLEAHLALARALLASAASATSSDEAAGPTDSVRAEAAAALRRALELSGGDDARARGRLASLYRAPPLPPLAAGEGSGPGLYALLRATHARLQHSPEVSDLAPEAARVLEILDRPLLVTVMGEFNAGKSTFVNALVGEEVAPMGITPTTATINVLKYGAERGGRVVYRDDTVRPVPWSEVGPLLRALDEAEATRIRFVEVLYPLETLQRVNIVDTPGLNSIRPEHEATAREFIAQADAVIWLFSCRQPGTASEREALGKVQQAHKKALGVVNQIDRLDGEAEVDEVLAHLREHFHDRVEALVPFSAREALLGRSEPARLLASRQALLERTLEERFFNRAKAIQRAQAARRAGRLLEQAGQRAEAALSAGRRGLIDGGRERAAAARRRFARFLDEERLALIADLDAVYAQAAREVLDFVRPRSWPFGANQAAPADRDFLVDLVEERLSRLTQGSRRRVVEEARAAAAAAIAPVLPRQAAALLGEQLRLLDEQVYGRYRAFIRGFLRGGRVDEFFTRVLPKLELGEQAIRRGLLRDLPALDVLEEELLAPLARFGERFFDSLAAALGREAVDEDLRRLELEQRLVLPLAQLGSALSHFPVDDAAEIGEDGAEHEEPPPRPAPVPPSNTSGTSGTSGTSAAPGPDVPPVADAIS